MFQKILVATDFGEASEQAVTEAIWLAETVGAELVVIHVCEVPGLPYPAKNDVSATLEANARRELDRTLARVRARFPRATESLRLGSPWREIIAAVDETKADLVVIGTNGRRGLDHMLLGSVAEKVVRHSPVRVLTVHAPRAAAAE
jgi:nucleotide-binding universal stress UspA family protein